MSLFIEDPTPDETPPRRTLLGVVGCCGDSGPVLDPDEALAPDDAVPEAWAES